MSPVLNMRNFCIWEISQYVRNSQPHEYVRLCLDTVLNIFQVLNMPGFSIWQGFEYARVIRDFKYATV